MQPAFAKIRQDRDEGAGQPRAINLIEAERGEHPQVEGTPFGATQRHLLKYVRTHCYKQYLEHAIVKLQFVKPEILPSLLCASEHVQRPGQPHFC